MYKILKIALFTALFVPFFANAQTVGFTNNLSYGDTGSQVNQLQEFLIEQGVLAPQYDTGNFYSITLTAVKIFQNREGIVPVSGYVGPITRGTINTILASQITDSEGNAATTTPPVDLSQIASTSTQTAPVEQLPVIVPVSQSNNPQPVFGSVSPSPATCQLTGTSTQDSASSLNGTIDWTTQNSTSITLVGNDLFHTQNGTATYHLTPVSSGEIRDLPIPLNGGSNFTATLNDGNTCSITLP